MNLINLSLSSTCCVSLVLQINGIRFREKTKPIELQYIITDIPLIHPFVFGFRQQVQSVLK